ncbi:MAG TPA: aminoacetone oxidase family FAD-binding enzyme [Lachnospiraceae bacterium]|nr:aminoacetone oxidase family FAD-binding enzyme [Lachnospiraceae bacterium]
MGYSVGIVGGGAAGMMAAITAARCGALVTLLEGKDRPGKKILSTGNGKCNLGNEKLDTEEYYTEHPDFLEKCLGRFGTTDTVAFFQEIGLMLKRKSGYLYPLSEQASSVLDVLRYELHRQKVQVITDCKIEAVEMVGTAGGSRERNSGKRSRGKQASENRIGTGAFREEENGSPRGKCGIKLKGSGKTYCFDRVILACGGQAAPKTGSDGSGYRLAEKLGHSLVPVVPALVQLRCREDFLKAVAGVRADVLLTAAAGDGALIQERGELQLTDYGISGIPVFQVSRVVNYILRKEKEVEICLDFLPDITEEALGQLVTDRKPLQRGCTVEAFFTGLLNKKLMLLFIRLAGLKAAEDAASADPKKMSLVYRLCKCFTVHVIGSNSFDNAQVCAGGVPLDEVTEQLESRKAPGIYFAGEILDVDGRCGGYNLQWAWCSGYIAGMAAAGVGCTGGSFYA